MIFTNRQAVDRISVLLEEIQRLHSEARDISVEWEVPFHLSLQDANGYTTDQYFNPSDAC